jgi:HemY protein
VVAALTLGDNDGLASFYWSGWRLDLSLNFFLLAALAIGFAVVSAVRGLSVLLRLPRRAREWRDLRRERAVQAAMRESMGEYFAGRYSRAQKAAERAMVADDDVEALKDEPGFKLLAQLMAAASLHRLQDRQRRDAHLGHALALARRGAGGAVADGARLLAAEWALDDRDSARAEALLAELPPGVARRTHALRLRLQAQRLGREPLAALHTARLLAKHQAFSPAAAQGLLRSLAFEALDASHDLEQLRRTWARFDAPDQADAFVVARAARRAADLGAPEQGRQWLNAHWERLDTQEPDARAEVALALMHAASGVGNDWLARAESAQRQHPADAAVLAAVGAVYAERQLWGKAHRPLELAAHDERLPPRAKRQAWRMLARLAREEGDEQRALQCLAAAAAID